MKRLMIFLLALTLVVSCAACGEEGTDPIGTTDGTKTEKPAVSGSEGAASNPSGDEITLNEVLAHPVTPEADFVYYETADGGIGLLEYSGTDPIVVIPDMIAGKPVQLIGKFMFANQSPVRAIRTGNSLKEIGEYSFTNNASLEYVVCGNSVKIIGSAAFQSCTALKEVHLNEGLHRIDQLAFADCSSLKSVTIPETVEIIGVNIFFSAPSSFTIIGTPGSTAEEYAANEGFPFQAR